MTHVIILSVMIYILVGALTALLILVFYPSFAHRNQVAAGFWAAVLAWPLWWYKAVAHLARTGGGAVIKVIREEAKR